MQGAGAGGERGQKVCEVKKMREVTRCDENEKIFDGEGGHRMLRVQQLLKRMKSLEMKTRFSQWIYTEHVNTRTHM